MHTPYGTCIHGPVLNHIRIMKHHNYAMSVASVHARYQVRKIEVTSQVKSSPQDRSDKSSRVRTSCEHLPKHWNPAQWGRRGQRPGSCMRSLELIQTHWNATGSVHVLPCEVLNSSKHTGTPRAATTSFHPKYWTNPKKHLNPDDRHGQYPVLPYEVLNYSKNTWTQITATGSDHVLPCEVLNLAPLRYIRSFTLFMCWVRGRTAADHLRHGGVTLSAFCPSIL